MDMNNDLTNGPWARAARRHAEAIAALATRRFVGFSAPLADLYEQAGADWQPEKYYALAAEAVRLGALDMESDVLPLLCSKQADYGTKNILRFGHEGLAVRLWDKIARVGHLKGSSAPRYESLQDSYIDIVGYCIIGCMLDDGTFELPLVRPTRWVVEVRHAEPHEKVLQPWRADPVTIASFFQQPQIVIVEEQ